MGASQIGGIGVLVSVITVLEQEHGTELEIVQTLFLLATGGKTKKLVYQECFYFVQWQEIDKYLKENVENMLRL